MRCVASWMRQVVAAAIATNRAGPPSFFASRKRLNTRAIGTTDAAPTNVSARRCCVLEGLAEDPVERARKRDRRRQGQDPGHDQIADSAPLQARAIADH